jgi:DegV family protein with EDD domain
MVGTEMYIDKLTIDNDKLIELARNKKTLPKSSQPTMKAVENVYNYLLSYYDSILVFTVAKVLSGTNNVFNKCAEAFNKDKKVIHVIDSKQNSVAQGLIVWQAAQALKRNLSLDKIITKANTSITDSKILVKIETLDNMIASGRLSVKAGRIAKKIGLKPIVTLDEEGKGGIFKVAFSSKSSHKKILKHIKSINDEKGIKHYAITYVDDQSKGQALAGDIKEIIGKEAEYVTKSSGIIAVGAGQGAVAVAYITD